MPAESDTENSLSPIPRDRSMVRGDVPDTLKRRYYTDERGGEGLGFYVDARITTATFRDRGHTLVAARLDPNAIRDMATIAQHRGWKSVAVQGSPDFRRETWLTGRAMGLEVWGYRATDRDLQELQRRQDRADRAEDRREVRNERREDRRDRAADERVVRRERREDAGSIAQMRVVDAVVRNRVSDPERQERILAAARDRIAEWLERGARFTPPSAPDRTVRSGPERRRDR